MTLVGIGMLVVFGFLSVRHFRNGRLVWAILSGLGALLGAGSLWVDYQRATADPGAAPSATTSAPATQAAPAIRDYQPPATTKDAGAEASE